MPHCGIKYSSRWVAASSCKRTLGNTRTQHISIFLNTLTQLSPQDDSPPPLDMLAAVRYTQSEVPHGGRQMLGAPPNMGVGP